MDEVCVAHTMICICLFSFNFQNTDSLIKRNQDIIESTGYSRQTGSYLYDGGFHCIWLTSYIKLSLLHKTQYTIITIVIILYSNGWFITSTDAYLYTWSIKVRRYDVTYYNLDSSTHYFTLQIALLKIKLFYTF